MPSLISCGKINKNIIFPIIGGFSKIIAESILYKGNEDKTNHPLILGIASGFGMSLSIIPYIFLMVFSRRTEREERIKSVETIELIYNDLDNDLFKKKKN